jgi:WD40 repeat protein
VSNRQDYILFSGTGLRGSDVRGLFDLTLPEAKPRTILRQMDNRPPSLWLNLSLSTDNKRAVATQNGRLAVIDLVRGTVEPLGDDLFIAAWSPDGRWLAALKKGEGGHTIIMDAATLSRRRVLGPSELDWSPDSHYLLGIKQHDRCGPYYGTLEAIDVESGARTTIESSKCQVNQATTGWVINDVAPELGRNQ